MGTFICVAIWILLFLGFIANFIVFAVMSSMQNVLGIQTCAIIFLIFIAIIGSAVLTYNTIKEENKDEKIKDYKREVHELWERIRETEMGVCDNAYDLIKSKKRLFIVDDKFAYELDDKVVESVNSSIREYKKSGI